MFRVISISTDESILQENSRAFNRVEEYSNLSDEFIILVFTLNYKSKIIEKKNGEKIFKVVPIYGHNKIFQVWELLEYFAKNFGGGGGGKAFAPNARPKQTTKIFSQDAFEIGLLSLLLSKIYNFELIIQIHTDISTKFFRRESVRNFLQFCISVFVLKFADKIRVVSNKMKNYLQTNLKIPENKIYLLPIYVDINNFEFILKSTQPPLKGGEVPRKILMISRIEEVKNIPLGIRAVQAYRKISGQDVRLRIVGRGNLKEKYLEIFRDKNFVEWADWTHDVGREFHNADLTLITSDYEGWGLTAVESVACGTPVAISPVGVANEFIVDGVNGFVSRGHDIINIMEAIYKVLDFEFDANKMQESLKNLDAKQAYLEKLQKIFSDKIKDKAS